MQKPQSVKVSKRYQVALPSQARQRLQIEAGDRLLVDVQDGMLILLPQPDNFTAQLAGLHREVWADVDAEEYVQEERRTWTPSDKE